MKTSYRHRRLIQEREFNRFNRAKVYDETYEKPFVGPPQLKHTEAVDLILEYVDDRELAMRDALQMLAIEIAAVYDFIDDVTSRPAAPGSYARGQAVVMERLADSMRQSIKDKFKSSVGQAVQDGLLEFMGEEAP